MPVSIVTSASNRFSASSSKAPFLSPAQPMSGTDSTVCPGKSRLSRQSRFSSSKILTSSRLQQLLAEFVQHGDYLLAPNTGKTLKEINNGVSRSQVIEQALHGHTRADEHRRTPQDFPVRMNHAFEFHGTKLLQSIRAIKTSWSSCG